jgi:diguanylate cyclase (GGDEF)-like protein/PAS domain S-box-containing protein
MPKPPRRKRTKASVEQGAPAAADKAALGAARAIAQSALESARAADARLREAIDILPQGIVFLDAEGRYVLWNKQYAEIYKRSADLFEVGRRLEDTLRIGVARGDYPEAKGREEQWLAERLKKLYAPGQRHEQWLSDGRCILIEERATSDGGIIGLRVDITEMKHREASFRLMFEENPVAMFVFDQETKAVLSANKAALGHYGFSREEMLERSLLDLHDAKDHAELDTLYHSSPEAFAGHTWVHRLRDGRAIDVAIYSRPIVHDRKPAVLLAAIDITERKRAEAKAAYLAHYDALTGLANRTRLRERLDEVLRHSRRGKEQIAVICIDLNNFKAVNEELGHRAGDSVLQAIALRIRGLMRDNDLAARLGGNEFAVVIPGVAGPVETSAIAERVIRAVSEPCDVGGQMARVMATIGIAIAPGDGDEADLLLANAGMALFQAKEECRGGLCYFEPEINARAQARRRLEADLRAALAAGGLEVHYQPLADLKTGEITGAEALVRWPHPELGFVSPAEFIPLAEECGLIAPLGAFVLKRSCADAMAWPDGAKVAVNISPLQFRAGTAFAAVADALEASRLPPSRLEIEITETIFLERSWQVLDALHALRDLGVRVAMDDFGTGYSSLSYLRSFPFDKIKIDRSFVREIATKAESQAIVRAIAGIGASLGITITAEGIETDADLAHVRAAGCDQGQGYLFSKACPQAELLGLFRASRAGS